MPRLYFSGLRLLMAWGLLFTLLLPASASAKVRGDEDGFYHQHNLVSDIPGRADFTDNNLKNPWGLSRSATSPWWVADNGTGVSTLFNGQGVAFPQPTPLVVTIPSPTEGDTSAPTGTVFNGTGGFTITEGNKSGSSLFLFATEDGTIVGWNPQVNQTKGVIAVDKHDIPAGFGAVYKGLAIASTAEGTFIYATNFRAGKVEVYDHNFSPVNTPGAFTDPKIPALYAPFGIQTINNEIFVTYAKQKLPDKMDDLAGQGHGFVDVFSPSGQFIRRLITRGQLNSPWGLAKAPSDFGPFSNKLLVGNFGNGRINVYDPVTGKFEGRLKDSNGKPIQIDGLWSLAFGNDANAGKHYELFFTAGLNDEADGLFGKLTFMPESEKEKS